MNKEFKKYDQKAHRIAYIGIETLNKILHEANAKIVFITRDVELSNCYQAYLENIKEEIIPPLSLHMYEARYFNAKCSVENYNEDEIPACIIICEALGIKTVSYEWSKDYYGRQNSDEIKLTYTI